MKSALLGICVALGIAIPLETAVADPSGGNAQSAHKPYLRETCIVSDDKLGEMGKPVVFIHKGQEIKLCCKPCKKDFDKDPAKFLKKPK
jgi:hypothetical protein